MKNSLFKALNAFLIILLLVSFLAPIDQVYAEDLEGSWVTENNRLFTTIKPNIEWKYDGNQKAYKLVYSLKSTFSEAETTEWITSTSPYHEFEELVDNTYFVRAYIKDENGSEIQIKDTLSFTVDTVLPQGGFVINQDQGYTDTTEVTLNLNAYDSNGVTFMSIQNADDSEWGEWILYEETYPWELSGTEGQKIVNVRFMDIAGNISKVYIDFIVLGSFGGSIDIENGKGYVDNQTVNLSIEGTNVSEMRFSNDGIEWTEWEPFSETKTYTLSPGNGWKEVFAQLKDSLGNIIQVNDSVLKGKGIPTITKTVDDTTLSDIETHWAKEQIKKLVGMEIINGYLDKTFKPNNNITREEFIKMIVVSMGLEPIETEDSTFKDIENDYWAKPFVEAAVMAQIIKKSDFPDGFNPKADLTREEIAKIVVRAMGRGDEAEASQNTTLSFPDSDEINDKGYVKIAEELGIITGLPDGSFAPKTAASRAQASVVTIRMIEARSKNNLKSTTTPNLEEAIIDDSKVNTSMLNLLTVKVGDKNNNLVDLENKESVIFDNSDNYSDLEGVTAFRGNNYRDSASYGTAEVKEKKLEIIWNIPIGRIDTWSGVGWNGQPAIVKWSDEARENMNIYDNKNKDGLKEVIYGALDGKVYFLDLENGEYTRNPIALPGPIKGSVSVDPRGIPLLYVGQGIDEVNGKKVEIGYRIYSLIDQSKLYFINGRDSFAYRGWGAFDSTALIDKNTDTMVVAGENGILYQVKLNSDYNTEKGTISIDPEILKYRYWKSGNSYQGIENSVVIYKNLAYFADNGGWLHCVDLNTLKPLWVRDVTDDTDSTIVLEEEKDRVYIYTACEVDKQGEEGFSYLRKIDALTGNLVWEKPYKCISLIRPGRSASNGGAFATPIVGKHQLEDLIIFNLARSEAGSKGKIVALDKESGKEVWTLNLQNYSWSSPVDVYTEDGKGYIVVCNSGGVMYLLDGSNGAILDKAYLGSNVEGSPAIYNDMIVVGTRGQKIFGIKIK